MIKVKKNVKKYRILLALLLIPLFFINVKDSHDWGDDFAQYLIQAKNIVEKKPQTENGLLFDSNTSAYAIEAYPVGLPLLIAPIYYFAKLDIQPYCIFFSFALFITGIICFEYFRKKTSFILSVFLTLIFCYNFQILELKKQILSEIPFTCILLLLFVWTEFAHYKKKYSFIVTAILLSFLISLRLAGFAAIIGFVFYSLNQIQKNINRQNNLIRLFLSIAFTFLFFIFLNKFLFPIVPGHLANFYLNSFQTHDLLFLKNAVLYYSVSQYIFPFFGMWIPAVWILFALCGWLIKSIQSASLAEFVFPIYLMVILFYPYGDGGARFLLPILPLLIFYLGYLIKSIFTSLGRNNNLFLTAIYLLLILACASPVWNIINHQGEIEDGPQKGTSEEMFTYIKTLPSNSVFVFCRARAFSLYTGRKVLYTIRDQSSGKTFDQFQHYKSIYLIAPKNNSSSSLKDIGLENLLRNHQEQYENIWENEAFEIYRQN